MPVISATRRDVDDASGDHDDEASGDPATCNESGWGVGFESPDSQSPSVVRSANRRSCDVENARRRSPAAAPSADPGEAGEAQSHGIGKTSVPLGSHLCLTLPVCAARADAGQVDHPACTWRDARVWSRGTPRASASNDACHHRQYGRKQAVIHTGGRLPWESCRAVGTQSKGFSRSKSRCTSRLMPCMASGSPSVGSKCTVSPQHGPLRFPACI